MSKGKKLRRFLPTPRESFFWTVGYLLAPTMDRMVEAGLQRAKAYLVGLSMRLVMKRNTSGLDADVSTSQERSQDS